RVDEHHLERHLIFWGEVDITCDRHDLDKIAAGHALARLAWQPIEANCVQGNQPLPFCSRTVQLATVVLQEGVEALACGRRRHGYGDISRLYLQHAWSPRQLSMVTARSGRARRRRSRWLSR